MKAQIMRQDYALPMRSKRQSVLIKARPQSGSSSKGCPFDIPTNRHIYHRLQSKRFRILVLAPGTGNQKAAYHLQTLELTAPLQYEAVSYVWASATDAEG